MEGNKEEEKKTFGQDEQDEQDGRGREERECSHG
jgi:hypothetical protein